MQNIKNVVEAIGADIGNINRNYQSLTARLQELESRQATPPEAVGDDGKAAAPSGLVELKYSYAKPDYLRGQSIYKQLRLPIPEAYRGKYAVISEYLYTLETDEEGYYTLPNSVEIQDEGSVSIFVLHGAPVVQNALQVDFSQETAEKMKAYKLDNYLTDEDKALFPFNAAQFVKNNYSSWYAMFEQLPRGEGLPEYGADDSESLQRFIGEYYERLKSNLDAVIENISSVKYYVDEEYHTWSDAVYRAHNDAWQAITENDWNEVQSEETLRTLIDKYKNSEALWREFLPKYTDIRNRLMQALKDRREAQHGEEIRKLVAAGAVLVDG